ncbi:chorismate mutase [Fructilactobacillus myrtifloralis]|uniref:Chorismate mutase n=1 Tax=Fructilactobacillus myrtifloralis TaxID=2940301 RepID=A0ABY5BLF3_9LACO|nr:chorismate mutase [Fructilactobacillus myrtifloralis]USS84508.1 chorismate mutase [Fructilactobacillus myrtifloralis]
MSESLQTARQEMQAIDAQLIPLLVKRLTTAQQIAAIKQHHGWPIFDPTREQAVLRQVQEAVADQAEQSAILEIYQALMNTTKKWEKHTIKEDNHA